MPFDRFDTSSRTKPRTVLAIGGRATVAPRLGGGAAPLCDENGVPTGASLETGTEVEVVAWIPRGQHGTRYRVRSVADAVEGWLDAASVQAVPPAPRRPPVTKLPGTSAPQGTISARPRRSTR